MAGEGLEPISSLSSWCPFSQSRPITVGFSFLTRRRACPSGCLKGGSGAPRTSGPLTHREEGTPAKCRPQSILLLFSRSPHQPPKAPKPRPKPQPRGPQGAGGGGRESLQPPPVVGMGVGMEAKEGLRQVGPRVKREAGGEKTGPERREGQRQVGPHVKGAGAGSYYLLGSRCPPVSPGSAGSSVTEHRVGSIRAGAPAPRGA